MNRKVLFIHPYFGRGGAEKGIQILSSALKSKGHLPYLYYVAKIDKTSCFTNEVKSKYSRTLLNIFHLCANILNERYDDIILNQGYVMVSYVIPLRLILALRSILGLPRYRPTFIFFERIISESFWSTSSFALKYFKKYIYNLSLKSCDTILTNSLEQQQLFLSMNSNYAVTYIPNSSFCNLPILNKETSKSQIHILWVGRLEPVKSPLIALNVIKQLPANYNLHIFGSGSLLSFVNSFIKLNDLSNRILINPRLDSHNYDLLLHTSAVEGLPNAIIEALSKSIPVITTRFRTGFCELFIPYWVYPCNSSISSITSSIYLSQSHKHSLMRAKFPINHLISNFYSEENMVNSFLDSLGLT